MIIARINSCFWWAPKPMLTPGCLFHHLISSSTVLVQTFISHLDQWKNLLTDFLVSRFNHPALSLFQSAAGLRFLKRKCNHVTCMLPTDFRIKSKFHRWQRRKDLGKVVLDHLSSQLPHRYLLFWVNEAGLSFSNNLMLPCLWVFALLIPKARKGQPHFMT